MGKNFSCNNVGGKRRDSDLYETPYSITQQLLDTGERFEGNILEPSCGKGAISKILEQNGLHVTSKDISLGNNFLEETEKYDCIITNPPYSLANDFILKAKEIAEQKIAMLLPLSYLHGETRYKDIWLDSDYRLKKIYVFTRYPMLGGNVEELRPDGKYHTGMMVYAWYVWDKNWQGEATIDWISNQAYIIKKGE